MKKFTFGIIAASALLLTACDMGSSDSTQSVNYLSANLVTPKDGSASFATPGTYTVFMNITQGTLSIATNNLMINNTAYSFATDTTQVKSEIVNTEMGNGQTITIDNPKGFFNNNRTLPLLNGKFVISSLNYKYGGQGANLSQTPLYAYPVIISHYDVGSDYTVRTFPPDACYLGNTSTTYPTEAGTGSYYNKDMVYRVEITDFAKKKANVYIYQAKFAEAAPTLTGVVLKDLNISWENNYYTISGENITPGVIEGTQTTPNDKYVFDKFNFTTVGPDMTNANITYEVAGKFKGSFSGSYMLSKNK